MRYATRPDDSIDADAIRTLEKELIRANSAYAANTRVRIGTIQGRRPSLSLIASSRAGKACGTDARCLLAER